MASSGKLRVYKADDPSAPLLHDYDIVERDVLQLTDMHANSNKFYALELHRGEPAPNWRIYTHYGRTGDVESNPSGGRREARFTTSEAEARREYANIKAEKERKGYRVVQLLSSAIGSDKAREQYAGGSQEAVDDGSTTLSPQVAQLVRDIYKEADLALASAVSGKITSRGIETPLGVLQMAQVLEGEEILKQIGVCLQDAGSREELKRLCGAFFTVIPHKIGRSAQAIADAAIDTEAKFESWQEAIQLMKDMLKVQAEAESVNQQMSYLDMRYAALRCNIEFLSPSSPEYGQVYERVMSSQVEKTGKDLRVNVLAIYKVERPAEQDCYRGALGNQRLLFHGSRYSNYVGLLSRGLLMPKVVVGRGGKRTDAGNLGNGIYFGDSSTTAAQYTKASANGDRLFLVNQVALGSVKEYTERTVGMSEAPIGYHSVHGVRATPFRTSFFEDDEYVVFSTEQQRMQYIVQCTLGTERASIEIPESSLSSAAPSWPSSQSQTVPQWGSSQPEQIPFGASSAFASQSSSFGSQPTSFGSQPSSFGSQPSSFGSQPSTFSQSRSTGGFSAASGDAEGLSEELRQQKGEEDALRARFARGADSMLLRESSDMLINVGNSAHTFVYEQWQPEEEAMMCVFKEERAPIVPGHPSLTAAGNAAFRNEWDRMTCKMFQGMDWSNVFAAGGSVLLALGASPENNSSDIDLFLYGLSEDEADRKVKHIVEVVQRNSPNSDDGAVIRTQHALTIIGDYPNRHVQIVLRLYKNPAEVLMGFDIDCCAVGFDGVSAFALPRARRAINRRYNLVDLSRRSLTYESRLFKYAKRGYAVLVPAGDGSRVPDSLYTYAVSQVKGLAKLLLLERQHRTGYKNVPVAQSAPRDPLAKKVRKNDPTDDAQERLLDFEERDGEEASDYDNVMIPWGPQWSSKLVLRYLLRADKEVFFGSKAKDPTAHKHVFVSGVDGVLSGTSCWCSECKSGSSTRSIGGEEVVSGRINWTKTDPGRQLLTGSFHPVSDQEWFTDAYSKSSPAMGNRQVHASGRTMKKTAKSAKVAKVAKKSLPPSSERGFSFVFEQPKIKLKAPAKKATMMKKAAPMKKPVPAKKATVMKKAAPMKKLAPAKKMAVGKAPRKVGIPKQKSLTKKKAPMKVPIAATQFAGGEFGSQDAMPPSFGAYDEVPQSGAADFGYGPGSDDLRRAVQEGAQSLRAFGQPAEPLSGRSLASESVSAAFSSTIPPQSYVSKLLLLISRMAKDGLISKDERGKLKDMVLEKHPMALSALEVFEVDNDFDELADTFKRICKRA